MHVLPNVELDVLMDVPLHVLDVHQSVLVHVPVLQIPDPALDVHLREDVQLNVCLGAIITA